MNSESKIKEREDLIKTIESLKKQGKKIVHCHGCFDLIHPGHIRHLKFAKEQGDILLVSITGDDFVGKSYMNPFATQDLRAQSLASIEYVDLVHVNLSPTGTELIKEVKPDIYIKGQEYAKDKKVHPGFIEEKELVESFGGKIVYSPGDVIFSSTQIIKDLLERSDVKDERINNFIYRHGIGKLRLADAVDKFKNLKVLVIGDLFIEEYISCAKPKVSSSSPVLNFDFVERKKFLGGAGLVAQYILNLGGDVKVLSVGDDSLPSIAKEIDPKMNGKIEFIKKGASYSVKKTFHSDEQKIFELNEKSPVKIDEKSETELVNRAGELLDSVNAIIFCDYGHGFLNKNIVNAITEKAKEKNVICTSILESERIGGLMDYKLLDFVVCSENETRQVINNFTDGIDFLARDFLARTQYKNLIVNLGKEGLICYSPVKDPQQIVSTYAGYVPFLLDNVKDGSGAREILVSTILLSLVSKLDIYHALYLGNCASSIASSKTGSDIVTREELKSFIETRRFS